MQQRPLTKTTGVSHKRGCFFKRLQNMNPLPSGKSTSSVIKSNCPLRPFASPFFRLLPLPFRIRRARAKMSSSWLPAFGLPQSESLLAHRHRGFCLSRALKLSHRWVISSAGHNADSQITAQTPYLSTAKFQINCAWQNPRLAHRG